jgi:hypothetical protein
MNPHDFPIVIGPRKLVEDAIFWHDMINFKRFNNPIEEAVTNGLLQGTSYVFHNGIITGTQDSHLCLFIQLRTFDAKVTGCVMIIIDKLFYESF